MNFILIVEQAKADLHRAARQDEADIAIAADIFSRLVEMHGLKEHQHLENIFHQVRRLRDRVEAAATK